MNRPGSSCNVYTVTRGLARYGQNRFYWKNWDFCAESLIYITKSDDESGGDETDGVSFSTWAASVVMITAFTDEMWWRNFGLA